MLFLPMIACVVTLLPSVIAICCKHGPDDTCPDGSSSSTCCAHGKCNLFCCNCDGGCRVNSGKRDFLHELVDRSDSVNTVFMEADTDGMGNITLARYLEYMGVEGNKEAWVTWFEK
jgi:hypothetical protein